MPQDFTERSSLNSLTCLRKTIKRAESQKENPSLRIEKLHPKGHQVWSFRVDISYRIVFKFVGTNHAELCFIGHHNQIYDYDILK